ncbi:MAG: RNA polymerase sigma factor [Thiobacillaceae bacterium]
MRIQMDPGCVSCSGASRNLGTESLALAGVNIPGMEPYLDRKEAQIDPDMQLRNWVLLVAAGDETALGRLYDATLSRVYGLALKVCGRRDMAEDAVVETYWQAWREATRFNSERGTVMAWLLMICRSRALDMLRRRDDAESYADPEALVVEAMDGAGSPLEQLVSNEASGFLNVALGRLTPIQRQLVALAFYKGLSHQEICDHTGLPLGTVKSHLKRAQDGLRAALSLSPGMHHD